MARSSWKCLYIHQSFYKKLKKKKISNRNTFLSKTYPTDKRDCTVLKFMLHMSFYVHRGNSYRLLKINKYMYGFKLGEFAFTRKPFFFTKKKKKKIS